MAELKDIVSKQIMEAMKSKDKIRLNALRYLKKLFIENDTAKKQQPELDIVIAYTKKMKESLALYPQGSEQHKDIEAEILVLEEFLPKQLTEDQVRTMIKEIKSSIDAPNMGAIMKELTPKIKGQFDGKLASQLVQESLK